MIKKLLLSIILSSCILFAQAVTITYSYDTIDRLTAVSYSSGQEIGYIYDDAGNILSVLHDGVVTDIDGDGIPDNEDSDLNDGPLADYDNDGLINQVDPDDDNDGIPDEYELANGLDPFDASDANEDADGDGYTNLEEYQAGTLTNVNPLSQAIVSKTKYFLNSIGDIGVRNYVDDYTYTGSSNTETNATVFEIEGVYEILGNTLILTRISPSVSTLEFTYLGNDNGVLSFNVSIDGGIESQEYFYDTEEERNATMFNNFNPAVIMYLLN